MATTVATAYITVTYPAIPSLARAFLEPLLLSHSSPVLNAGREEFQPIGGDSMCRDRRGRDGHMAHGKTMAQPGNLDAKAEALKVMGQ